MATPEANLHRLPEVIVIEAIRNRVVKAVNWARNNKLTASYYAALAGFSVAAGGLSANSILTSRETMRISAEAIAISQEARTKSLRVDYGITGGVEVRKIEDSFFISLRRSSEVAESREDLIARGISKVKTLTNCPIGAVVYTPRDNSGLPVQNEGWLVIPNCPSVTGTS